MKKLFAVLYATMLLVGCGTTTKVEEPKTDENPDSYVEYLAQKDQEILDAAQAAADQKKQEEYKKYDADSEEELAAKKREEYIAKYIEEKRARNEELAAEDADDVSKDSVYAEYDEATDTLTTVYSFKHNQELVDKISSAAEPGVLDVDEWLMVTASILDYYKGIVWNFDVDGYEVPQHIHVAFVSDIDPKMKHVECIDGVITYDILQSIVEKYSRYQEYVELGMR